MKKIFLLFLFIMMFWVSGNVFSQTREKMAILPFKAYSNDSRAIQEMKDLQGFLTTEILKTKKFTLVERARLDEIMKEMKLSSSSMSYKDIQRLGQTLGVNKILTGEFVRLASTAGVASYFFTVNVRIIDVRTGFIDVSITIDKERFPWSGNNILIKVAELITQEIMENY